MTYLEARYLDSNRNPARSWAELAIREGLTPYAGCPEDEQVEIQPAPEHEPFELDASRIIMPLGSRTPTLRMTRTAEVHRCTAITC